MSCGTGDRCQLWTCPTRTTKKRSYSVHGTACTLSRETHPVGARTEETRVRHRRRCLRAAPALASPHALPKAVTRLVCAMSAVVHAADTSPTRRRQGRHQAPRAGCGSRYSARGPPQSRPGGRGGRQRAHGVGSRAQTAERLGPRWTAAAWSLGRAAAPSLWCPFGVLCGGREIATVRGPRRLRGGSRRVGAGLGVQAGRASQGRMGRRGGV